MKKEKEEVMVKARMTIKTGFSLILLLFASTFCVCMSMSLICKYPAFCYNSMAIQTLSSLSLFAFLVCSYSPVFFSRHHCRTVGWGFM